MLNPRATASNISSTSKKLGATLPSQYTAALDAADLLRTVTAEIGDTRAAANDAIIDCIRTGKPWLSEPGVPELLLSAAAAQNGIAASGHTAAEHDLETAITDHADAVIDCWNHALAADAEALANAANEFGDLVEDLGADAPAALTQRGVLQLWGDCRTAVHNFDVALGGWKIICHALSLPTFGQYGALALGDPDELDLPSSGPGLVWQMARVLKEPMRLPHPDEYRQRVIRRQADRAAAVVQAEEAAEQEFKRRLPMRVRIG